MTDVGPHRMNIGCSSLRSCLTMQHMSSLLFISAVGPPLSVWQPREYVKTWLAKGRRRANDTSCKTRKGKEDSNGVYSMQQVWRLL